MDLLVLLCFHANANSFNLYFRLEAKQTTYRKLRIWNIKWLQKALQVQKYATSSLLFMLLLGCGTTSRLFGVGKGAALKKLTFNSNFKKQAKVFSGETTKAEIISAGEEALTCLYGGQSEEGLDALRFILPNSALDGKRHNFECRRISHFSRFFPSVILAFSWQKFPIIFLIFLLPFLFLSNFSTFSSFLFHFSSFSSAFYIFSFFPCLVFPDKSPKLSRW